jgi:hypothetical protein
MTVCDQQNDLSRAVNASTSRALEASDRYATAIFSNSDLREIAQEPDVAIRGEERCRLCLQCSP